MCRLKLNRTDSDAATTKPVSRVAWRGDSSPRPQAQHAVRRTAKPIKVAAKAAPAIPIPVRSPQANQQTTDNAVASETARASETALASAADPQTTTDVPHARTAQEQVAAASAVAERMSVPTLDASLDALVAVLVTGPDVKSVSDLAGKTIAIDDRYSEQSISRVRTAMVAAGALEAQLSKGQTTAINRLVGKEVRPRSSGWSPPTPRAAFPRSRASKPSRSRCHRDRARPSREGSECPQPATKHGPGSQKPNKNKTDF